MDPAGPALSADLSLLIGHAHTGETLYARPTPETLALDRARPTTVEHHVSSILGKLNVSFRDAAVMHARVEGWIPTRMPGDRFEK